MKNRRLIIQLIIILVIILAFAASVYAEPVLSVTKDGVNIGSSNNPKEVTSTIQIILLLTVLSLAPSILIMMTGFTRIIIILSFLRNALGTQQMPPNQVMIGLALFLTFFSMSGVFTNLNNQALQPYSDGKITQQQALDKASFIMKDWMVRQIFNNNREKDLELFASMSNIKEKMKPQDASKKLPLTVVIPAFMISELTIAFRIGFLIFLPFLVIDMVVSSTLMSMGMMMLPPVMISLPFKILLFILIDGWAKLSAAIVGTFVR